MHRIGGNGRLPETPHYRVRRAIGAISLSGGPQTRQGCAPDLGDGYHLYPAVARIPLPGGDRESVLQKCSQLEAHGQSCHRILSASLGDGDGPR